MMCRLLAAWILDGSDLDGIGGFGCEVVMAEVGLDDTKRSGGGSGAVVVEPARPVAASIPLSDDQVQALGASVEGSSRSC